MSEFTVRLTVEERKKVIIEAAVKVAQESVHGVYEVTAKTVSEKCGVPTSQATIKRYFAANRLRQIVTTIMEKDEKNVQRDASTRRGIYVP